MGRMLGAARLSRATATPMPRPSDPAQNPSRMATYRLYEDFLTVRNEFGC